MMRIMPHVIVCILWLALQPGVRAEDNAGENAHAKLREADELARKGQAEVASKGYLEAASLYEEALKSDPDTRPFRQNHLYCLDRAALVLIRHADALRKEENFSAAAPLYALAVRRYEDAHAELGREPFARNIKYARHHGARAAFRSALAKKDPAPEFELPSADESGEMLKLSDYRGKIVALEFFTTWCPSCLKTAPEIARIQRLLGDEKFVALGVSLDTAEGFKRRSRGLSKFLESTKAEHPVALGDSNISQAYAVESVPAVILIDHKGNLVKQLPYDADFEREIKALLDSRD